MCRSPQTPVPPVPVLLPEPDRDPTLVTVDEVDAILLDRAHANLRRHAQFFRIWALYPIVRCCCCFPGNRARVHTHPRRGATPTHRQHGAVTARVCREIVERVQRTTLESARRANGAGMRAGMRGMRAGMRGLGQG